MLFLLTCNPCLHYLSSQHSMLLSLRYSKHRKTNAIMHIQTYSHVRGPVRFLCYCMHNGSNTGKRRLLRRLRLHSKHISIENKALLLCSNVLVRAHTWAPNSSCVIKEHICHARVILQQILAQIRTLRTILRFHGDGCEKCYTAGRSLSHFHARAQSPAGARPRGTVGPIS
jgi:hypothetical protein